VSVFGALDGHGDHGHEVAAFVQRKLPLFLSQEATLRKPALTAMSIKQAVKKVRVELDKLNVLRKQGNKDPTALKVDTSRSGCCAIFGVYLHQATPTPGDRRLIVANIGDSRAVIGRQLNIPPTVSSTSGNGNGQSSNNSSSSSSYPAPPSPLRPSLTLRASAPTSSAPVVPTSPASSTTSTGPSSSSSTTSSPPSLSASTTSSTTSRSPPPPTLTITTNSSSNSSTTGMGPPSPLPTPSTPTEPLSAAELSLELLVSVVPLSTDHKPGRPDERARIEKAGGRVGIAAPGEPYRVFQGGSLQLYPGIFVLLPLWSGSHLNW
jgi:hypothetical protein